MLHQAPKTLLQEGLKVLYIYHFWGQSRVELRHKPDRVCCTAAKKRRISQKNLVTAQKSCSKRTQQRKNKPPARYGPSLGGPEHRIFKRVENSRQKQIGRYAWQAFLEERLALFFCVFTEYRPRRNRYRPLRQFQTSYSNISLLRPYVQPKRAGARRYSTRSGITLFSRAK